MIIQRLFFSLLPSTVVMKWTQVTKTRVYVRELGLKRFCLVQCFLFAKKYTEYLTESISGKLGASYTGWQKRSEKM